MAAASSREWEKLLTKANALRAAGDDVGAEEACQQVLAVHADHAGALELLGDILLSRGQATAALDLFRRAFALNPERAVLEEKIGLASIRRSDAVQAVQRIQAALDSPEIADKPDRNPAWAFLLSALLPGAGQLYNTDYAKGLVVLGMALAAFALLRDFLFQLQADLALSIVRPGSASALQSLGDQGIGALAWLLIRLLLLFGVWTYAIIEAPIRAARLNDEREKRLGLA